MRDSLRIHILGDICPDRQYNKYFEGSTTNAFNTICEYIKTADIVVGNLEAPVGTEDTKISKCGPCLHCYPNDIDVLKRMGIDVLSLANNHILDFGGDAVLNTIKCINATQMLTVGAGKNSYEARQVLYIERKGWKVGVISFAEEEFNIASVSSPGANLFDPYDSLELINKAKDECDLLIILYHGGIEHYSLPSPLLQKKCRAMVRAGANIVLCQHSHCIGTYEKYESGEILYGQGNSIFGYKKNNDSWNSGLIVDIVLRDEGIKTNFRLIKANEESVKIANEDENSVRILKMLADSKNLNDLNYIKKEWASFCKKQEPLYLALFYGWGRILNKLNRLFNNYIGKYFISKKKKQISMNLVRCDSHREVVETIFKNT